MNICILISSLHYGGSSQVAIDLACGLKSKGNKITVITIWNIANEKYCEMLKRQNIELKSCNKKNRFDFFCYKRLKKILQEGNFDLINTHLSSLFYCCLAKPLAKVVHTIHSLPNLDIPKFYYMIIKKWAIKTHACFVACSDAVFNKAVCYLKQQDVRLIKNGFDCDASCVERGVKKTIDFIYVGRLVKMKNVKDLINAFNVINKGNNHTLYIVGEGNEKENLEHLCKENNSIYFAGGVDNVFEYLHRAKVFCLFSDYEGAPICLLEAMSCGLPAVCSDIDGNRTYIDDGKNGFLFQVHNVVDASKKMIMLLNNEKLYNAMSERALITSKENSVDKMVDRYDILFKEINNEQVQNISKKENIL